MRWYHRVTSGPDGDLNALVEAMEWFEKEYDAAKAELVMKGKIEIAASRVPGLAEYYFGICMEVEHIMKWLDIQIDKKVAKWRRHYIEHYNRELSASLAEKFATGEKEVIDLRLLYNHVALVRNQLHGITKGIEYMHFQIGNIVNLRKVGIEDASL
jgi:hypothetical protein